MTSGSRQAEAASASTTGEQPAAPATEGEVVLIMGLPAAGKSTVAESFVAQGYERLNRDTAGGSLSDSCRSSMP